MSNDNDDRSCYDRVLLHLRQQDWDSASLLINNFGKSNISNNHLCELIFESICSAPCREQLNVDEFEQQETAMAKVLVGLINRGGSVNCNSHRDSRLPLNEAVSRGLVKTVEFLLYQGAVMHEESSTSLPIDDPAYDNNTLYTAIRSGYDDIVTLLLRHGAKPTGSGRFGYTALHVAAKYGRLESARTLLACGVNPNSRCKQDLDDIFRAGETALHVAVANVQPSLTSLLLQHGASPLIQDDRTMLPIDIIRHGKFRVLFSDADLANRDINDIQNMLTRML